MELAWRLEETTSMCRDRLSARIIRRANWAE